jgi:hypothetical protein
VILSADDFQDWQGRPRSSSDRIALVESHEKKTNPPSHKVHIICVVSNIGIGSLPDLLVELDEPLERSFKPENSFSGQISVEMTDKNTGPDKSFQFLIDLDHGQISESSHITAASAPRLGSSIHDCTKSVEVPAPTNELTAVCSTRYGTKELLMSVIKHGSNEQIRQWPLEQGWWVSGLAWSANSRSIAVLLEKERFDLGPLGLLSAASGHPIPLNTFKVDLYSMPIDRPVATAGAQERLAIWIGAY